ncbi:MAG TPA: tetratricopeptide repeat protein [Candidatus Angelobacter sp.]|nr:tetratricopeptide repeat protein [Candidatus Angelobacter sp.]
MVRRAVIVLASLFAFCLYSPAQQAPQMQSSRPDSGLTPSGHFNSVSGSVIGTDNKPVSDVRVELRDFRTGQVVSAMSTGTGGDFEFTGIAPGHYRVVAVSGTQQTEEAVEVSSWNSLVNLRMPPRDTAGDKDATRRNTITVAQYRVPDKAREELRKAREASTKSRMDEAQSHVAKALEIYPQYADALTFRAVLKLTTKDTAAAVLDLQKAIEYDGNYAMAYMVLGSAFNIQSKFDEAIRTLERGESLAPDAWQAYFELGKAYAGKADFKTSLAQLNRAATLSPDYSLIRLVRAHVFMQLHQFSDAVADLQVYLEKKPNGEESDIAMKMLQQAQEAMANAQR